MTNKEHQEWIIQKLNEDYVKRLEEYREIVDVQRTIIEQQKALIDVLYSNLIDKTAERHSQSDSCDPNQNQLYYPKAIYVADTQGE